jgi:putative spermidine/putrescine transport system substrate-binding protein
MAYDVTRRGFLAGTAASAAALALPQIARADMAEAAQLLKGSGKVVVSTWGGTYTDAQTKGMFAPFTKATGIEVVTTGTPDPAKLKLMEQSGNVEWDIVDAEGQMMYLAAKQGQLTPVDYDLVFKVVPKDELISDTLDKYGVPSVAFGWVLAWNTKTYPSSPPQNWADFWNVDKFKGRRAAYAQPKPLLEAALLAAGVPRDKIYPLDIDRGFAMLDKIKPHIDVWVADTGQYDVLLQNGEVDLMLGSLGRSWGARKKGFPVDYTFNDGLWEQSYWIVPKGAPNSENAMKLLAWMCLPDVEAGFVDLFPVGVPNQKAYALMKPDVAANLPTAPQNLPKELFVNAKWWTDNLDAVNRRWLEWYTAH